MRSEEIWREGRRGRGREGGRRADGSSERARYAIVSFLLQLENTIQKLVVKLTDIELIDHYQSVRQAVGASERK